jgi:hypothetical protein
MVLLNPVNITHRSIENVQGFPISTGTNLQYSVYELKVSIGFEVLTAVVVKVAVSWDVTPCSSTKIHFYQTSLQCIPEDSTLLSYLISTLMRCPQLHSKTVSCMLCVGSKGLTAVVIEDFCLFEYNTA